MIITDGSGSGYDAKVDSEGNLHSRAVRTHEVTYASLKGESFNAPYGSFTLTSATESALSYFLWADTVNPCSIYRQLLSFGPSTGGAGLCRLRMVRNPTGGTLISGGTAVTSVNNNFSNSALAPGTWLKGAQGSTVTGGTTILDVGIGPNYVLNVTDINWILANGNSLAVAVTPPAGNTSMAVYLLDQFYKVNSALVL